MLKSIKSGFSIVACAAAIGAMAATSGYAATILSFEDGTTNGVVAPPPGQSGTPHVLTNVTTNTAGGATDGTHALTLGYNATYQQGSGIAFNSSNAAVQSAFLGSTTIQIDLTRTAPNPADYLRFDVAVNYRNLAGGYPYLVGFNETAGASPASIVFGGGEGGTKTLSFTYANSYSSAGAPDPTNANFFLELVFITNSSGPGDVTIDNVRFVNLPEPLSLTGLLGASTLLVRRRHI